MTDIESRAWNCGDWSKELGDQVERAMEVSDRTNMSTEQVVAYAILAERERCASIAGYGTPEEDWHPDSIMGTCGARISRLIRDGS